MDNHISRNYKKYLVLMAFVAAVAIGMYLRPYWDNLVKNVSDLTHSKEITYQAVDEDKEAKEVIRKSQEMQDFINLAIESKLLNDKALIEKQKREAAEKAEEGYLIKYSVEKDRTESAYGALVGDENSKSHIESIKKTGNMPIGK